MPHHIYRRKGSDNWWLDVKIKGRGRIRRSAGTADRAKAEALAVRIEAQEWERLIKGDPATLTFAEAVKMYLADGHSGQFLAPLVKHFKDAKVAEIKQGHIRSACRVLYPNAKPATWNRQVITPARAVINNAAAKELAAYIKVEKFPELRAVRPVPADDWLERFIAKALDEHRPRLAAIALFTRITGARIGQAIELDWRAVDLQSGTAIIPPAKGYPERLAELTPQMVAMLANLSGQRRGRVFGYVSPKSVYKPWRRICRLAGLPYITSHLTGRRGFFTTMARAGADVKTAMENGGMKSSRLAVEIYTEAKKERGLITSVFGTIESQSGRAKLAKHRKIK